MDSILNNPYFLNFYRRLETVRLNPTRHTAPNARAHSEAVADLAGRLGRENGCSEPEQNLLVNLGYAHDIGKITGSARPEHSLEVLRECREEFDNSLMALVKWHDTALPWFLSFKKGEPPSDKAWQRLEREVDFKLLCIFMVADRVDAPGGWRCNEPTTWFLEEAQRRNLVGDLQLDLPDHPSLVHAGGVLTRHSSRDGMEVLLIRSQGERLDLPEGAISWGETLKTSACRAVSEWTGLEGVHCIKDIPGHLDTWMDMGERKVLKRVYYFLLSHPLPAKDGKEPRFSGEQSWYPWNQLETLPLSDPRIRTLLQNAIGA